MRETGSHRLYHATFTALGTALLLIAASAITPEVSVQAAMRNAQPFVFVPETFDGGGYGSTAESAVNSAIEDAENTASGYGLYTCELVEAPEVFPQPPGSRRAFTAQVRMRCTP